MKNKSLKTEQFFKWIDDECFRNELSDIIKSIKSSRKENQSVWAIETKLQNK